MSAIMKAMGEMTCEQRISLHLESDAAACATWEALTAASGMGSLAEAIPAAIYRLIHEMALIAGMEIVLEDPGRFGL